MVKENSDDKINSIAFAKAACKLIEKNYDEFNKYYKMFVKEESEDAKIDYICAVE